MPAKTIYVDRSLYEKGDNISRSVSKISPSSLNIEPPGYLWSDCGIPQTLGSHWLRRVSPLLLALVSANQGAPGWM